MKKDHENVPNRRPQNPPRRLVELIFSVSLVFGALHHEAPFDRGAEAGEPPRIHAGTEGKALPASDLDDSPFTIAILPDRTTGRPWGIPYLDRAVSELNLMRPDVVFTIGDMVQGYTRSEEQYRSEVDEYFARVNRLDAPFYPLPGNHDVISGDRDPDDRRFEDLYREYFGPLYYAAQFDGVTVIALYSDEQLESAVRFGDEQVNWARGRIQDAAESGDTIAVLMHKPAWRYRDSGWDRVHRYLAEAAREYGGRVLVAAGHFHSMQREPDRDGVQYHLVGTCGALIDQHPLTGQLQHLTMLKVARESGDTTLYHHPIGCTLPDDFVLADDQRRAFMLKSWDDVCEIQNALDQPIIHPVRGAVRLKVRNPLDRPAIFDAALVAEPPEVSLVEGYGFVSRTPLDIFNPHVTRADTPFEQVEPFEPVTLQPEETKEIEIELRCAAQGEMLPPPQINVTATFEDDQGRTVPVVIRRRVPLNMRYVVGERLALNMPISAWEFSVYDRRERDPVMGLSASDGRLNIAMVVFDDAPAFEATDDPTERVENPESDAVIIEFGRRGEANARRYLIEPLSPEHVAYQIIEERAETHDSDDGDQPNGENASNRGGGGARERTIRLEEAPDVRFEFEERSRGFGLIVRVPLESIGSPGETAPFNLRVADNDETYHTQWREWSHDRADGVIVLPSAF